MVEGYGVPAPPAALPSTISPAAEEVAKKVKLAGAGGQNSSNLKYTRQGNSELRSLTGREAEFHELGDLTALYDGLSTHVRQHVNPLSSGMQVPTAAPKWEEHFTDPTLPLQVDVGCGSGRFVLIRVLRMASTNGTVSAPTTDVPTVEGIIEVGGNDSPSGCARANVLGLEIRGPLVTRANIWAERLHLRNCHFIFTNATVSWKALLSTYPGPIELVSMQFPDPYFKKKHFKRRHVQPQLVKEIAETLAPGARVFLQGDVPEAVRWMRDMFERHTGSSFRIAPECRGQPGLFREEWQTPPDVVDVDGEEVEEAVTEDRDATVAQLPEEDVSGVSPPEQQHKRGSVRGIEQSAVPLLWPADPVAGWLPDNPLGVPTEREVYVAQAKAPVYRMMLLRVK